MIFLDYSESINIIRTCIIVKTHIILFETVVYTVSFEKVLKVQQIALHTAIIFRDYACLLGFQRYEMFLNIECYKNWYTQRHLKGS